LTEFEEWRPIAGFEGVYEVSDLGRVRSLDRTEVYLNRKRKGRVLKQGRAGGANRDYRTVTLGARNYRQVHQLACTAFHGEPIPGNVVRHLDGDSFNNLSTNLAWGTRSENHADAVRHGTHGSSSKTHCPRGHEYTSENTRHSKGRVNRICRTCDNARRRRV
jgi:hypothetical protein